MCVFFVFNNLMVNNFLVNSKLHIRLHPRYAAEKKRETGLIDGICHFINTYDSYSVNAAVP